MPMRIVPRVLQLPAIPAETSAGPARFRLSQQSPEHGIEPLAALFRRAQPVLVEREEAALDQPGEPRAIEHGLRFGAAFSPESRPRHRLLEAQPHHQHLFEALGLADRVALLGPLATPLDRGKPALRRPYLAGRELEAVD